MSVSRMIVAVSKLPTFTQRVVMLDFRADSTIRTVVFTIDLPAVASGERSGCKK